MCGLAAIYSYRTEGPLVDPEELLRTREAMRSRGPDGAGLWVSADGRMGLAHRRLAIIDLSEAGAQPMSTIEGALRIVFNGEIYNYRELRHDLEATGCRFQSNSDTEVLLQLYRRYGVEMVHRLRGMFAFVICDEMQRGIFMARDQFGIKPLYYSDNGQVIRVASQVKALLAGSAIDTSPEPAGQVGFFLWGHVPEPYTLYKSIRALPAGSTLWIDHKGRREPGRYFNLTGELARSAKQRVNVSPAEAHETLRMALLGSVRRHLIADVPVGVFLSSGLDSTTLAALAKEAGTGALRTVTLAFDEFRNSELDEAPLAESMARQLGSIHETHRVTRKDFDDEFARLLAAMDQPSTDGVNSYFVSKVAADAGLKVALSGLGGDELFGGYPSFRQIPRMVRMFAPFQFLPSLGRAFCYVTAPILKHFTSPKYAGLLQYGGSFGGAYLLRRGLFMPWELPEVLDGETVRLGWEELGTLLRLEETAKGAHGDRLRVMALETAWYMRNQLLRDADWASMAHSLEIRVPFVDVDLFRAVIPLLESANPPTKREMAMVPQQPLPEGILRRKKTGFAIPTRDWLPRTSERLSKRRGLRGWALALADNQWRIHANARDPR